MPTLIDSGADVTLGAAGGRHFVALLSDGNALTVFSADSINTVYSVRVAGTWGAAVSLLSGTALRDVPADMVQVGDAVYLLWAKNSTLTRTKLAYSAGSVTVTTSTVLVTSIPGYGSATTTPTDIAVWYNNSALWVAVAGGAYPSLYLLELTTSLGLTSSRTITGLASVSRLRMQAASQASTSMFLAIVSAYVLYVVPISSGTPGTIETVPTTGLTAVLDMDVAFDNTGKLDILIACQISPVGCIAAIKRTGTAAYGAMRLLDTDVGTVFPNVVTAYHISTGDLWAFWQSFANGSDGEIHVAKRTSGAWSPGYQVVSGIDFVPEPVCTTALAFNTSTDTAELVYVGSGTTLNEIAAAIGAAPNTPSGVTPSGYTGSITPTIGWTYTNSVSSDGQSAYEIKVTRTSDSHVMWDSGYVSGSGVSFVYGAASNTGDANYVAPATLVKGTQYAVQVRVKDTNLSLASGYSSAVDFTPIDAPAPTLDSITAGGVASLSSPATVDGPALTVALTHHQAQGDAANAYALSLYKLGMLVDSITGVLSPSVADGASHTLPPWTPAGIANGTTYTITASTTDATTGLAGVSSAWTITTSYTAPSAPAGLSATNYDDLGAYMALSWGTVADTSYYSLYRRTAATDTAAAGPWGIIDNPTGTSAKDWPKLLVVYDYAVTATNAENIESAKSFAYGVAVGLPFGHYGTVITDPTAPQNVWVALGFIDPSGWGAATELDHTANGVSVVFQGRAKPVTTYDLTSYQGYQGRAFNIQDSDNSDNGGATISGDDTAAQLRAMNAVHGPYLIRDAFGYWAWNIIENLKLARADETAWVATYDQREEDYSFTSLTA